jgi:hypothetical protein
MWASVTAMQLGGSPLVLRPDELAVLATACRTADIIARLEDELGDGPLMVAGSKGQEVVHPAVVELRLQRAAVASLLRQLAIPDEESSGWDNLTASQRARRAAHARWTS